MRPASPLRVTLALTLLLAVAAEGQAPARTRTLPDSGLAPVSSGAEVLDATEAEAAPPPSGPERSVEEETPREQRWMLRRALGRCTPRPRGGGVRPFPEYDAECAAFTAALETGEGADRAPLAAAYVYERFCERAVPAACTRLARLYVEGRGVRQDVPRAARLYERACGAFENEACNDLGLLYASGIGVPRDEARAQALFQKACGRGSALACANVREGQPSPAAVAGLAPETRAALSRLPEASRAPLEQELARCYVGTAWRCTNRGTDHARGRGVPRDAGVAAAFFEQACAHQSAMGCKNLAGLLYTGRGVVRDEARALALFERACEGRVGSGCTSAGVLRLTRGQAKVARARFEAGCGLGDRAGCSNAGWAYERGQGVRQDARKAFAFYVRGCEAGLPLACRNAGVLHARGGPGVQREPAQAARRFEQACTGGDATGCASLGTLLLGGDGVAQDLARAERLLAGACEAGVASGCLNLGWMHDVGRGVAPDAQRAAALYARACDLGEGLGCVDGALLLRERAEVRDERRAQELARRGCLLGRAYGCASVAADGALAALAATDVQPLALSAEPVPARASAPRVTAASEPPGTHTPTMASASSASLAPTVTSTEAPRAEAGPSSSAEAPGPDASRSPASTAVTPLRVFPNQPFFDVAVCARPAPLPTPLDEGALLAALEALRPRVHECLVPPEHRREGALQVRVQVSTRVGSEGAKHTVQGDGLSEAGRACVEGVLQRGLVVRAFGKGRAPVTASLDVRRKVDATTALFPVRGEEDGEAPRAQVSSAVRRALPGWCDCYAPVLEQPAPTLRGSLRAFRHSDLVGGHDEPSHPGVQALFDTAGMEAAGLELTACLTRRLWHLEPGVSLSREQYALAVPLVLRQLNTRVADGAVSDEPEVRFAQLEGERSASAGAAARAWGERLRASEDYATRVKAYEREGRPETALEGLQWACARVMQAGSAWGAALTRQRALDARMLEVVRALARSGKVPAEAEASARTALDGTDRALAESARVQQEDRAACPQVQEVPSGAPPRTAR